MKSKWIFWMFLIFILVTGCTKEEENLLVLDDEEVISCLEEELFTFFHLDTNSFQEISLEDVTNQPDQISYFKGIAVNDEERYILYRGEVTYDFDVMKDFDLYFGNRYSTYQRFEIRGIHILAHHSTKVLDAKSFEKKCVSSRLSIPKTKVVPSSFLSPLQKTKKIVIRGSEEIGSITNEDVIQRVLQLVSSGGTSGNTYLCDGHSFEFAFVDENLKELDTITVWSDGRRFDFENHPSSGCFYYTISSDDDFLSIIEDETDYVFHNIFNYSSEKDICDGEFQPIYEDENYLYSLSCLQDDSVYVWFFKENRVMKLSYALQNHFIQPDQLHDYNHLLVKMEK